MNIDKIKKDWEQFCESKNIKPYIHKTLSTVHLGLEQFMDEEIKLLIYPDKSVKIKLENKLNISLINEFYEKLMKEQEDGYVKFKTCT